jgi:DNA-binding NarL/FixJ family response regulator
MNYDHYGAIDEARPETFATPELELGVSAHRARAGRDAKPDRYIALVESRTFMRDCLHRGMQAALSLPVATFSTLSELESQFSDSVALVFLCLADARQEECANALKLLSALDPSIPVVVLAAANDMELAKTAINFGAKGYIPSTANFEIAIEAVRFILAGGAYVPIDYLLASGPPAPSTMPIPASANLLTDREISVVRAIQEGNSNKVIAYKLSICEGTVKVHLRNIMRKMKARNRTEVAIKAQTALALK